MKKTRKLIPAIAMLLMSTVMMSTASFAWFSMNQTVDVGGMKVNATATGSLLISTSQSGNFEVSTSFNDTTAKTLAPCTYISADEYNTYKSNSSTALTGAGYYYVNNPADVDPNTGLAITSKTLYYTAATAYANSSGTESGNYVDYVVYLKAEGAALNFTDLTATVDFGTVSAGQLATTVDFLLNTTAVNASYTGYTVTNAKSVVASDTTKSVGLGALTMTEGATYAVVMRVYVDGAAKGTDGKAYVNSTTGNVADVTISVNFAEAASA